MHSTTDGTREPGAQNQTSGQLGIDLDGLLTEYIALCNRAIAENVDSFWYRQAKRLNEKLWGRSAFRTLVYDRVPDRILGEYTLRFDPGAAALTLLPPGDHEVAFTWKIPLDYLRDVVMNRPTWYLENPVRLDWNWVSTRIRDESATRIGGRYSITGDVGALALGATAGALGVRLARAWTRRRASRQRRNAVSRTLQPLRTRRFS